MITLLNPYIHVKSLRSRNNAYINNHYLVGFMHVKSSLSGICIHIKPSFSGICIHVKSSLVEFMHACMDNIWPVVLTNTRWNSPPNSLQPPNPPWSLIPLFWSHPTLTRTFSNRNSSIPGSISCLKFYCVKRFLFYFISSFLLKPWTLQGYGIFSQFVSNK